MGNFIKRYIVGFGLCAVCKKKVWKPDTFYSRPIHQECMKNKTKSELLKMCFMGKKK